MQNGNKVPWPKLVSLYFIQGLRTYWLKGAGIKSQIFIVSHVSLFGIWRIRNFIQHLKIFCSSEMVFNPFHAITYFFEELGSPGRCPKFWSLILPKSSKITISLHFDVLCYMNMKLNRRLRKHSIWPV